MPKIYEIINAQSIDAVRPYLQRALDTIGMEGLEKNRSNQNIYLFNEEGYYRTTDDGFEAGPLLVSTVHNLLMAQSLPDSRAPHPFTHRSQSSLSGVIRQAIPGLPQTHLNRISGEVSRILRGHSLILPIRGSIQIWVRGVSGDYNMGYRTQSQASRATKAFLTRKDEAQMLKREAEMTSPKVVVRYGIPAVPRDPTPENILEWARLTKGAFDKLNERFSALQAENEALQEKLEKLGSLEEVQQWKEVGQGLASIIEGNDNGSPEVRRQRGVGQPPEAGSGPYSR